MLTLLQLGHGIVSAAVFGAGGTLQAPFDTSVVYRELAAQLGTDVKVEKYFVVEWAVWGSSLEEIRPWLDSLAHYLDSEVVPPRAHPTPLCPWDLPPSPDRPVGYNLRLELPEFDGDTSTVLVRFTCKNPEGYLHVVFARDDRYWFARRGRAWVFVRKRTERIT